MMITYNPDWLPEHKKKFRDYQKQEDEDPFDVSELNPNMHYITVIQIGDQTGLHISNPDTDLSFMESLERTRLHEEERIDKARENRAARQRAKERREERVRQAELAEKRRSKRARKAPHRLIVDGHQKKQYGSKQNINHTDLHFVSVD